MDDLPRSLAAEAKKKNSEQEQILMVSRERKDSRK
jgi:hypothetical protein